MKPTLAFTSSFASIVLALLSFSCFGATVGNNAPDYSLPALQNSAKTANVTMRDFRGKVVYVDFWASWCGPCRKSMPVLDELRNKYNNQGFEVVAINVDENTEDALGFLKKYPVSYPVLADPKGETPTKYNVTGMPTAYIVDKAGVIRYVHSGFQNQDKEIIENTINQLLAK